MGYLQELLLEKDNLDPSFVHAQGLLVRGRLTIGNFLLILYLGTLSISLWSIRLELSDTSVGKYSQSLHNWDRLTDGDSQSLVRPRVDCSESD